MCEDQVHVRQSSRNVHILQDKYLCTHRYSDFAKCSLRVLSKQSKNVAEHKSVSVDMLHWFVSVSTRARSASTLPWKRKIVSAHYYVCVRIAVSLHICAIIAFVVELDAKHLPPTPCDYISCGSKRLCTDFGYHGLRRYSNLALFIRKISTQLALLKYSIRTAICAPIDLNKRLRAQNVL